MRNFVSILLVITFVLGLLTAMGMTIYGTYHTIYSVADIKIKVLDKERVTKKSGDSVESYYLVFTEGEVFKNEDSIVHTKFNSSDIQGKLQKDSTYTVTVAGIRVPVLSMYRNIIKINE